MDNDVTKSFKRDRLINFKVNASEYDRIDELAKQYAGGNISVWLRARGMQPIEDEADEHDNSGEADPILCGP